MMKTPDMDSSHKTGSKAAVEDRHERIRAVVAKVVLVVRIAKAAMSMVPMISAVAGFFDWLGSMPG